MFVVGAGHVPAQFKGLVSLRVGIEHAAKLAQKKLFLINEALIQHYKCPENIGGYEVSGELSAEPGFFRFGGDVICHGHCAWHIPARHFSNAMPDLAEAWWADRSVPRLPFDPTQIIENLRLERYVNQVNPNGSRMKRAARRIAYTAYYAVRPVLPVSIRRVFQKAYLQGRKEALFPHRPVDSSVEAILEKLLVIALKAKGLDTVPFIWFWPKGASACAVITHDVEALLGRDFCSHLMDIDDEFGVKASFQIVPERRYPVPETFLEAIRRRGFEVNIHDLNHDGHLYSEKAEFLRRVRLINQYGRKYGALGFRSAVLYRRPDWLHALQFNYDMSIPNVAHMEPQPGGCCTLFPYFIGSILEMPVTTTQDYTLFHILRQYSVELWKTQISLIQRRHGLISFIIHPDYIAKNKAQRVYKDLLGYLTHLRSTTNIWIALPREVDVWWRARNQMRLVQDAGRWLIEGPQREQACLAYAQLINDRITYRIEQPAGRGTTTF